MACLFCGKEIGPIRLLRDSEFCSPKHRKDYKDRLQKVLVRVGESETMPAGIAPFQDPTRPQAGNAERSRAPFDFSTAGHRTEFPETWSLTIPETRGGTFADLSSSTFDASTSLAPRRMKPRALPYPDRRASTDFLALPSARLGGVALRSTEGESLSAPIALEQRVARGNSPAGGTFEAGPVAGLAGDVALPGFSLLVADCEEMAAVPEFLAPPELNTAWMPSLAAEPVACAVEPSSVAPLPVVTALHLPEALAAEEPLPLADFPTPPELCESWTHGPAPEPVVCTVEPTFSLTFVAVAVQSQSAALSAETVLPQPALHAEYLPGPAPAPVPSFGKPAEPCAALAAPKCALPDLVSLAVSQPWLPAGNPPWMQVPASEPVTRAVSPCAAVTPVAFAKGPIAVAGLVLEPVLDAMPAPSVDSPAEQASAVKTEQAPPRPAPLRTPKLVPVGAGRAAVARTSGVLTGVPSLRLPGSIPGVGTHTAVPTSPAQPQPPEPQANLFTVEYYCQRGPVTPLPNLHWTTRAVGLKMPRFALRPVFDRLEDQTPHKREQKIPAFAEIFSMPDAAAITRRKAARHAITAIAASITVAMALWFGASAGKFGKDLLNPDAAEKIAAATGVRSGIATALRTTELSTTALNTTAPEASPQPAPSAFHSPVAWVKAEAAKRAAVQMSDSFQNGMEAWGSKAQSMAPGWSHHPDGYVRPGELALFQPTLRFTDYRMEFFGQIENKSMSWVVRGKDPQNYYAMKFNVMVAGLRPVLSMVHYPVVGGVPGPKVEMPLSVMVHNDMPYHVAVDVKGGHYVASIEGQEVDEWTDDSLLAGGVGFFSEAGARARIYWMKVTKNDDWFGRVCGYLAGGTSAETGETAWLERPEIPMPAPERPTPAPSAAVWPVETAETWAGKPQRGRVALKGAIEKWSS